MLLDQNYPNPFNPSTTIRYQVQHGGPVAVRVFDIQGRLVQTLVNKAHDPGTYSVTWDASHLASGSYFYRIEANGRILQTKQALLVK
jgi:flagellar hook assembly protein FlgD